MLACSSERTTVVLALPILDHCAVLTAMALVCRLAEDKILNEPNLERFEKLAALEVGHPVRVLSKGRLFVGEVANLPADRTATAFAITVSTKPRYSEHFVCTAQNCMKVEPSVEASQAGRRQRGLRIVENAEFTKIMLGGPSLEDLCLGTRLDYVLVGVRSRLLEEAETTISVWAPTGKSRVIGSMSDLLRLREGSRDYRGMIVSTTAKDPRMPTKTPRVAIFNGAAGYLKFRDRFALSHQVLLLDRSEPRFREAASQVNRQFYQRIGEGPEEVVADAPVGVERLVFVERP